MSIKIESKFIDRVGIVADISALVAGQELNIISMEVERRNDKAGVYIEVEGGAPMSRTETLLKTLGAIPGLEEIRFIDTLPHEDRENRFRVVLDNISDGVFSIDIEGKITTINRIARKALNCIDKNVVGKDIQTLKLPDYAILECLKGRKYSDTKKSIHRGERRIQYFATGRPVRDSFGRVIGAVEIARDMQEIKRLARSLSTPERMDFSDIIGQTPAVNSAIAFAQKIAATDSIISVRGASGTGKELFARAIHAASGRPGPFLPINCAAIQEQLLESELFGYVTGAFTGSKKEGKAGLFEIAREGTVFLDEIAEMQLGAQAKILRLIQEKRVRRIGGSREIPVDARVITATNRNLEQMVEDNLFRQDLYYRINVLPIHIPPLKERVEDIPLLVEHFLFQLASRLGRNIQTISAAALRKLIQHNWPGNIRELKNVVERAAILCEGNRIDVDCVLFAHEIRKNMPDEDFGPLCASRDTLPLKVLLANYEKEIIHRVVIKHNSMRKAAKVLQVSHTTLQNKMKRYRIKMANP